MKYLSSLCWLVIYLLGIVAEASAQDYFTNCITRTADNAVVVIPASVSPTIRGAALEDGDEIAVIAADGTCAGAGVWSDSGTALVVWAADGQSSGGMQVGDQLRFAVWDATARVEFRSVQVSYDSSKPYLDAYGLFSKGAIIEVAGLNATAVEGGPELVAPAHASRAVPIDAELSWEAINGVSTYEVQVSLDRDFDNLVANAANVQGTSLKLNSLAPGETYYWRVRASQGGDDAAFSVVRRFSTVASHTIALKAGWNLVSSYVLPTGADMKALFGPAADRLVLVKDGNGQLFWPGEDVNDIGSWDPTRGYKVFMTVPDTVTFYGPIVEPEHTPIPLQPGWNTVAYLNSTPMSAAEALASLDSEFAVLKSESGSIYMPELNIDNVSTLLPGEGYMVYVREPSFLTYPATSGAAYQVNAGIAGKASSLVVEERTKSVTETAASSAHLVVHTPRLSDGAVITVWSGSKKVGTGSVQNGRAILYVTGDDPYTSDAVEGARNGDALQLRYESGESSAAVVVSAVRDLLTGQNVSDLAYQENALWAVDLDGLQQGGGDAITLKQNFPNPFGSNTTIEYTLIDETDVNLEVYNALGQRVAVLVSETQRAGTHAVDFDGSGLASGMYFYRLTAGELVKTQKMTLVR